MLRWQKKAQDRMERILMLLTSQSQFKKAFPERTFSKKRPPQVFVKLVGKSEMIRLNTRYRGKKRPTDVLSFPAPLVFTQEGILGELILCWPVVQSQAKECRHGISAELDVLLVHGVLHLLGMDHELGAKEAEEMAFWEKKLLKALISTGQTGLIRRAHSGIKGK